MTTATIIKKIVIVLCKMHDLYLADKKELLNYPKMLEYLFYKPIHKENNLITAIGLLDDDFYPIRLHNTQKEEIESLFLTMITSQERYQIIYEKYKKMTNDYIKKGESKINFDKYIPVISTQSSHNIKKIADILDDLNIQYTLNWSFEQEDEYVNANKNKPYIFNMKFSLDFFGCMFIMKKNRLTHKMCLFAIEYDYSSKKITDDDYLKQYYLQQMNIHLLRLNNGSELMSEINHFIKTIKKNNKYIIKNGLIIASGLDVGNMLIDFYENYNYNHNLYLKYYDKHKDDNLSDSEEDNVPNYNKTPLDNSYVISKDFAKTLAKSKYFFTNTK